MSQPLFGNADNSIVVALNNCHSPFLDCVILTITDFWFFVGVVCCIMPFQSGRTNTRKQYFSARC